MKNCKLYHLKNTIYLDCDALHEIAIKKELYVPNDVPNNGQTLQSAELKIVGQTDANDEAKGYCPFFRLAKL